MPVRLGKTSQKLLHAIQKIVSGSPAHLKKSLKFSRDAIQYLAPIVRRLLEVSSQWKETAPFLVRSVDFPEKTYHQSDLFNDIPLPIRSTILDSQKIARSYLFMAGSRQIRVHMVLPIADMWEGSRDPAYFRRAIHLIWWWFSVIGEYANCDCGTSVDVYLYLTSHYKFMPQEGPIGPLHANTAFTRTCEKNSTIQIFREEEWFKVLIHETFHSLGLEFSQNPGFTPMYSNAIRLGFKIDTDGLLFETYCEVWATVFNAMFTAVLMKKNENPRRTTVGSIIRATETILLYEMKFALVQSAKVLHYMNISYADFIHHGQDKTVLERLAAYREDTNVFCYYVLKSLMLYHIDGFLGWCGVHNKGSPNFVKTRANMASFIQWFSTIYKDPSYVEEHVYAENQLSHFGGLSEKYTLRMTLWG